MNLYVIFLSKSGSLIHAQGRIIYLFIYHLLLVLSPGAFFFSCACMHGRHWEGGGGGVGGGPIEQLHSDAMQQRTASEWKGEVGWVGGTDRRICFRNTRLT